jgi:hypothetical protein
MAVVLPVPDAPLQTDITRPGKPVMCASGEANADASMASAAGRR